MMQISHYITSQKCSVGLRPDDMLSCWNQKKDMVSQYSGWLWPLNDGTKGSKSKQMLKHIQILLMFLLGCKQIKTVYLKSLRFFFIFSPHQSSLSIIPQHNIDRIKMA